MKIALISDLHLDHWKHVDVDEALKNISEECKDAEIVFNAGDTGTAIYKVNVRDYFPNQVYLEAQGNHDYYHGTFSNDFSTFEYKSWRIFVGSLWTDFNNNPLAEMMAERCINDFRLIKDCNASTMVNAFNDTKRAIREYKPHIIMTHFAPFHKSIHPKYGDTPVNYFFCNDMKSIMESQPQLRLWMHGHTHSPMDYKVGACRVLANQLGYPRENYVNIAQYKPQIITLTPPKFSVVEGGKE